MVYPLTGLYHPTDPHVFLMYFTIILQILLRVRNLLKKGIKSLTRLLLLLLLSESSNVVYFPW